MFPYWLFFVMLAAGALLYQPALAKHVAGAGSPPQTSKPPSARHATRAEMQHPVLFATAAILMLILVGLRYKVGGDWVSYLSMFRRVNNMSFSGSFQIGVEPGYVLLNWLAGQLGAGIWLVNLVCAVPFTLGLVALSRQQPNPWLALVVAAPFFVIGVGMGYTRQAAAVGFLLIGLATFSRGAPFWKFVAWVLIASLFHRTALVAIPVGAMLVTRNVLLTWLLGGAAIALALYNFSTEVFAGYSQNYIEQRYEAAGAGIRVAMNAVPGAMALLFPRQFHTSALEKNIWRGWSLIALIAVAAYFVVPSSVAVDRMSIYIIPVQIYVLSRIPYAFAQPGFSRLSLTFFVVFYSAVVQFVWLNYANHAIFWVPYRIYLP